MITPPISLPQRIATSKPILLAFIATAICLVFLSAIRFQAPHALGMEKVLTDFDAFYIAGQMAKFGQAADAYHVETMLEVQYQISGARSFMPWTYPPPFTLLMQALSHLPIGVAYAIFISVSFGCYLHVLRRIAGRYLPGVLIAVMPVVILNLRTGQNGFLVASLIGYFLLLWRDHRSSAGLPLGLMIIKPHLAAGVGLIALVGRRWHTLALTAMIALIALATSTWAYGWDIWHYFFVALGEAKHFLVIGYYPLFRMNSVYAALYSYGLPASFAIAGHALIALAAIGLLFWISLSKLEFRFKAALVCTLSLFVSPYSYDYDTAILGIAWGFILPDLIKRCSGRELGGLLVLSWLTCGYGLVFTAILETSTDSGTNGVQLGDDIWPAMICPLLFGLCLTVTRLLMRPGDGPDRCKEHYISNG